MKSIFAAIILTLILVVSGCAIQQQLPEEKPVEQEPAPVVQQEKPVETPQVVEEQPKEEPKGDDGYNLEALPRDQQLKIKLVRKLLDEARAREENYFFRYSGPGILQTDVWVKGDMMKRAMIRLDEVDKLHPYNMVYLDMSKKTAEAYCETTKSVCPQGHGPFPENYAKWKVKTPKEWIVGLDNDFLWALDNKIADQLYHIVDYSKDGKTTRVYVNDYKGWPARVQIHSGKPADSIIKSSSILEDYNYDDMDIGGVSDDDVTPG